MKVIAILVCLVMVCSVAFAGRSYEKIDGTTLKIIETVANDDATTINQLEKQKGNLEAQIVALQAELTQLENDIAYAESLGIKRR